LPIQRVSSKWEKTKVLIKNEQLTHYIPETCPYTMEQLQHMLEQYGFIFIKPDRGTYGIGVMCLERYKEEPEVEDSSWLFKLRYGIESRIFSSLEEVTELLNERISGRTYLIQRGIELIQYNHRKFDLRVLVQKNMRKRWETTGYIGRVAGQHKIVTNYHNGGQTQPVEELFKQHLDSQGLAKLVRELRKLGEEVGYQLEKKYPRLQEIGLDVAVDSEFRPWVLEVNTLPALFPFKSLPDKSIYQKIRKYAEAYGRPLGKRNLPDSRLKVSRTKKRPGA
jgi:glutathione synthase/RimK-type ligase-like ATP-grasp enzyme